MSIRRLRSEVADLRRSLLACPPSGAGRRTFAILRRLWRRPGCIVEAAGRLGVTERQLRRRIGLTGRSPKDCIDGMRLSAAVEASRSDLRVAALAARLGVSVRTFERLMRRRLGVPPVTLVSLARRGLVPREEEES